MTPTPPPTVPAELAALPQWVAWRYETRDGKPTKPPYNARTGAYASSTDRATWTTLGEACAPQQRGRYDGVGFVFSTEDPYACVDLDHCRDAETGAVAEWARAIVAEVASYAEVSPSGTGIHLYVRGRVPAAGNKRAYESGAVEIYDHARYITITGQHLPDTPETLEDRQAELTALHARVFTARTQRDQPRQEHPPASGDAADDAEIIRRAMSATDGADFSRLWFGDTSAYDGDESRADLALCGKLAFWCELDPARIDALFRQSRLMRDKWERADYRERTIAKAMEGRTEFYDWDRASQNGHARATGTATGGDERGDRAQEADAGDKGDSDDETRTDSPYEATPAGIIWHRRTKDGDVPTVLTNYTARIVADVREDDGAEVRRAFAIAATLRGRASQFDVPAERFDAMNWATEHLGAMAILYPGQSTHQHAPVAVRLLSGAIPERHVYTHTGWRERDGAWIYLHGAGAIGAGGVVPGVQVSLDDGLARYALPEPPTGEALRAAVRASLAVLEVAPDVVTVPLYAAIWRAALGGATLSLHLAGQTGERKSALAALAQQHYGAEMDGTHLPASWSSTGNALEAIAFTVKDALLVVDDFVPAGTAVDVARLHAAAERVLRAQANGAGRQRMRADTTMRAARPPRGLILSTGEDIPRGHSLRARMLVLEVPAGGVRLDRLSACQRDAGAGTYAAALAGFLTWAAPQYSNLRQTLRAEGERLRTAPSAAGLHARTPENVAHLMVALAAFLQFAVEIGALTPWERETLTARARRALDEVAAQQQQHQAASDQARRFLELLGAAVATGRAHVATASGERPIDGDRPWGWRDYLVGTGEHARLEARPAGDRIGWLDGDEDAAALYLEPDAAYAVAQRLGRDTSDPLSLSPQTLRKRLRERGALVSVDKTRGTLTVRRTLEGQAHHVLHISPGALYADSAPDKPDKSQPYGQDDTPPPGAMSGFGVGFPGQNGQTRQPTRQQPAPVWSDPATPDVGFVGFDIPHGASAHAADAESERGVSGDSENPTPNPTPKPDKGGWNGAAADAGTDLADGRPRRWVD